MSTRTSKLIVALVDQVTGPSKKIAAAMRQLTGMGRGLSFGQAMTRDVRALTGATREFGRAASVPASMMAALGGRAVYNLEKTGNTIQAVTGMTDDQRASLEEYMRALNKDFPFTNAQIAQTALELARAGLSIEQMRGSLRDTLTLSLAGDIENAHAADLATNIMTAMRMPMETAEQSAASLKRIVDTLTYSANRSNTTVAQMGETFKYVAPIAAAAGMEIEQVASLSMVLANNGIKASEAGVALRSAIVRMVRPTKPMLAALDRLNVDLGEFVTNGRMINADDIIGSLRADGIDGEPLRRSIAAILEDSALQQSPARLVQALTSVISEGLGSDSIVDRAALSESLTEAVTAAGSDVDLLGFIKTLRDKGVPLGELMRVFDARQGSRLASLLTSDLQAIVDEVTANAAGSGDRVAAVMNQGIVGAWNRFIAMMENVANVMAKTGVLDDVTAAFHRLSDGLEALSKSNPKLLKFIAYAVLGTAALMPLGFAATAATAGVQAMVAGFRLFTTILTGPGIAAMGRLPAMFASLRASMVGFAAASAVLGPSGAAGVAGAGILRMLNPLRLVTAAFHGLKLALIGTGIGAILVGIGLAGAWIYNNWSGISTAFEAFKRAFMKAIEPIMPTIQPVIDGFGWLYDAVANLIGPIDEMGGGWASAGIAIGKFVGETIVAIVELPGKIAALASEFYDAAKTLGKSIYDGVVSMVADLADYIKSRLSAALSFVGTKASGLLNTVTFGLAGTPSGSGVEARASGGPVSAGGTYLVGEQGPELVTFGQSGFVHDAMKTVRIMRNAALAATASAAPAFAIPSVPSIEEITGSSGSSSASANGQQVEINMGGVSFQIIAAPGQSAEQIADVVERRLSSKLRQLSSGAFHDGVTD